MNPLAMLLAFVLGAAVPVLFLGPVFERRGWREGVRWAEGRTRDDVVSAAIDLAITSYGGTDGVFNAAGFSQAFVRLLGLRGGLDGQVVRGILSGRGDVLTLEGGAHFKHLLASQRRGTDTKGGA